jgi:hypothetical protein
MLSKVIDKIGIANVNRITGILVFTGIFVFLANNTLEENSNTTIESSVNSSKPSLPTPSYDHRFATDDVNIRSQPNESSIIISQLREGEAFYVLSEIDGENSGSKLKGNWLRIALSDRAGRDTNQRGFIYSKFASKVKIYPAQIKFCSAINTTRKQYFKLADSPDYFEKYNDMKGVAESRAEQIYKITNGGQVKHWEGVITSMLSSGGLSILLPSCEVTFHSGTTFLSNNYSVKDNKVLYEKLKRYQVGSSVVFSGEFDVINGKLFEASYTTDGKMDEPEFPFKINAVHAPRDILPSKKPRSNQIPETPFYEM